MKERKSYQRELRLRTSDALPFVDEGVVRGVIRAIMNGLSEIKNGNGEVAYPFPVSHEEKRAILSFLKQHHGKLKSRVFINSDIPLEEGVGTVIEIRERKRG